MGFASLLSSASLLLAAIMWLFYIECFSGQPAVRSCECHIVSPHKDGAKRKGILYFFPSCTLNAVDLSMCVNYQFIHSRELTTRVRESHLASLAGTCQPVFGRPSYYPLSNYERIAGFFKKKKKKHGSLEQLRFTMCLGFLSISI